MLRKRLRVVVNLVLLSALAATFTTGFVAAALDLNRFAYHKYAAYATVVLAVAHVVLHRRVLVAQVRRWTLAGLQPRVPTPCPGTGDRGRETVDSGPQAVIPRLSRRAFLWPGALLAAGAGLGHWWSSRGTSVALADGDDLGQVYHQWSKPSFMGLLAKSFRVLPPPSPYKMYPGAAVVPLPPIPSPGGPALEAVIARRRSVREYGERAVTLEELSRLLHYSAGITDRRDPTPAFRAAPSSGALFPIEVYPVLFHVEGVAPGVYHYDVERHRLELVRAGDFRREVFRAALSQEMVLGAALVLVLTGVFSRVQWKYTDRSYRYLMLEAGHIGQNVYLAATALSLGACAIGAFFDDDLNSLLGLDGQDEATVYLLALGPMPGPRSSIFSGDTGSAENAVAVTTTV